MSTTHSTRPITRLAWRHAKRRPWQSLFFVVGVAIGVAMIVAIDLANGSAERAFNLGAETVAGRATHQIDKSASLRHVSRAAEDVSQGRRLYAEGLCAAQRRVACERHLHRVEGR
ncbi:MAG: hypothetical protein R2851_17650 [Caldilineaceae bacterium]